MAPACPQSMGKRRSGVWSCGAFCGRIPAVLRSPRSAAVVAGGDGRTIPWAESTAPDDPVCSMARNAPLILTLDFHGVPHRWVTWQQACFYHAKNLVAWTLGEAAFTFYGGISRATGKRSAITTNSIIAIRGRAMAMKSFSQIPPLNNRELFRRDRHICGYCGGEFGFMRLTRDHITPVSRGGGDHWMNVVTACRHCNGLKRNRTPEEAGLQLLYTPYVPNKAEYLILTNRKILADQMGFLAQHVSKHSRVLKLAGVAA